MGHSPAVRLEKDLQPDTLLASVLRQWCHLVFHWLEIRVSGTWVNELAPAAALNEEESLRPFHQ